jgi:preprotein translocase subunit SecG
MAILGMWYVTLLAALFVLVCLFLMLVILIQKPRGDGLAGAFGGAGGSAQAAFGAKTGDVLTWFTVVCFAAFLILAMGLTWTLKPEAGEGLPVLEPVGGDEPPAHESDLPAPGLTQSPGAPGASEPTPGTAAGAAGEPVEVDSKGASQEGPAVPEGVPQQQQQEVDLTPQAAPMPEGQP